MKRDDRACDEHNARVHARDLSWFDYMRRRDAAHAGA